MTRNDKPKRDASGTPFRYEYVAPLDEVVRTLMRLDRPYWLMVIGDMHLEEGAAGYTFEFRQKIANRMTSEIRAHVWEDDTGRTIIDGIFRKRTWSLSSLFLTALTIAILNAVSLLTSFSSTPAPSSTETLFRIISLLNMILFSMTFFYALRYDTAYHVVMILQQLQQMQAVSDTIGGRSHLQQNDDSAAPSDPNTIWNQAISEYGDHDSEGPLHKKL